MDERADRIEERLAHLILAVEELSDQLRAQWGRIDQLERRLARLEAGPEPEEGETGVRIGG